VIEFIGVPPTFNIEIEGEDTFSNPDDLFKLKRAE